MAWILPKNSGVLFHIKTLRVTHPSCCAFVISTELIQLFLNPLQSPYIDTQTLWDSQHWSVLLVPIRCRAVWIRSRPSGIRAEWPRSTIPWSQGAVPSWMHVCMCTCPYECVCLCAPFCMNVYGSKCTCPYECMCVCVCTCLYECVCMCTCLYECVYVCIYVY